VAEVVQVIKFLAAGPTIMVAVPAEVAHMQHLLLQHHWLHIMLVQEPAVCMASVDA
jgi:hypothetical protein